MKVYSQWGEDGILDYCCEQLNIVKPKILEIGAGKFEECNSRFLAENRSASVFAVDGRGDLNASINLSCLKWKTHLFAMQAWVTPSNINSIISQAIEKIGDLDILSLDLDGNDYWILREADLNKVSIIVVEYNPLFGSELEVTIPRDDNFDRTQKHFSWLYFGASIKAYISLLDEMGFVFIGTNRVGNNAFFLKKNLKGKFPLKARSDLSVYTDWRVRESRSRSGVLSYLSGNERLLVMHEMLLFDLENGCDITVGKVNSSFVIE